MTPKRIISTILKLGFILALFVLIFKPEVFGLSKNLFGDVDVVDVLKEMRAVSSRGLGWFIVCIALATAVKLVGVFCGILRWKLLLRGQGLVMPFWYLTYLWFMGRAIGLFLPGTLGLDGFRLIESARYTGEAVKCTTVIAVEKLIGFIALTFLVFLTLPLGFKHFEHVNFALLGVLMTGLLGFVVVSFLLLLNPRLIQVVAEVLPFPGRVRRIVNRLGASVTSYSGHRGTLILAVFFGLMVHVATCFMHFFTFLGIQATNASMADIMFVSPLLIYASVITPTISGMGVREIAFLLVLGTTTGQAVAILGGHLGLWSGEIIPFLMSVPLLLVGKRPSRERLQEDLAKLREATAGATDEMPHLPAAEVAAYRKGIAAVLFGGLFAGLIAGAVIAFGEAGWTYAKISGLDELQMFYWGPVAYGFLFAAIGLGIGAGLVFLYLLFNRFPAWTVSTALCFAGTLFAGELIIGIWRYKRDVLNGGAFATNDLIMLGAVFGGVALVSLVLAYVLITILGKILHNRPAPIVATVVILFLILVGGGFAASKTLAITAEAETFAPAKKASGPNIILVAIDTLRADYLPLYNPAAEAKTPELQAFAKDAVVFSKSFAQGSWTKPSFATIFSGLYPHCHTAVDKNSSLPNDVETFPELLHDGGYYTQGFSNNPNIMTVFNFQQGFVQYVDLKPDLYFGAKTSSSKLSMYNVLRLIKQMVDKRILRRKMVVTEFYQPADAVNETGLDWIDDNPVPEGTPFFLFLHYMDPHDPFMDPESPEGGYARVRMEEPDPDQFLEPMRKAYIKEIEYLDQYLGLLFDELKQRGIYDDSLILLTADHGEEFYDHEGWWHGKTLYEELTHVPLMIKLPKNALGGQVNTGIARHVDLAPTLLQYAGVAKGAMMTGQSLFTPANEFANGGVGYSFAENSFEGNILQSVRSESAKLIRANEDNPRGLAPLELYNLAADPGEKTNLVDDPAMAAVEAQLQKTIDDFLAICSEGAIEPAKPSDIGGETMEQLESLGYLE